MALSRQRSPSTLVTGLEVTVGGLIVGSGIEIIKGVNLYPATILTVAVEGMPVGPGGVLGR